MANIALEARPAGIVHAVQRHVSKHVVSIGAVLPRPALLTRPHSVIIRHVTILSVCLDF